MSIQWDEGYSVGVELFDSHHKRLIDIIVKLIDVYIGESGGKKTKTSINIVSELAKYSTEHLAAEERAMEKYYYPDLENHRREHDKFREMVKDIASEPDTAAVSRTLLDWFSNHILITDKKYSSFFKDKEI
ncbi:MAG: hypothetical protein IEMM0002_0322 [bacterium]|nr:MAG: hypothetical protein IEMM0002_0322 [bacterium]